MLLCLPFASTRAQSDEDAPSIHVTGTASAEGHPDQVRLTIGVTTESEEAATAASDNAKKLADVIAALRKEIPKATVETINYSLDPVYLTGRDENEPKITSYRAMNTVRVETSAIDKVGGIVDAAMKAGATNIYNLNYQVQNDEELRAEALRRATARARAQADAVAASLGLKVTRVLDVEASGVGQSELQQAARHGYYDTSTMVDVSNVEVFARVELTVEIGE